jgi:recombination protein RecA
MAKKVVEENYGLDPEVMAVISGISKKYGDPNTIMVLGQGNGCIVDRELTSTGSICIDRAVGVIAKEENGTIKTGIPRGRIIEIFGPESSGKTTLLNHMIAQTQKQGKLAAIIDMEQTWDAAYAANIGVDTDKIVFSQPSYAEQALDILDSLVRTGKFGIICLDSIAALVPQKELEGQMGESSIGVVARLMSQALRKINGFVNRTDTIVVMTNQIREKIGVLFGSPETTPGGNAMKYYASIRIDIRKIGQLKDGSGDVIGNRCKVKIIKNKVAPPMKSCEFDILYGEGIDNYGELVDIACDFGILVKKGSWFSYGSENIAQGRGGAVEVLKSNKELFDVIKSEVLLKMYGEVYNDSEQEEVVESNSQE